MRFSITGLATSTQFVSAGIEPEESGLQGMFVSSEIFTAVGL